MKTSKNQLKREIKMLKNSIAEKCLDCLCLQPKEIIHCQNRSCPLWNCKPYRLVGIYTLAKKLKEKNLNFFKVKK